MVDGPSQRRSRARSAVVWDALVPLLDTETLSVLDVGGGSGSLAVRIAEAGHGVTLIDPSPDAVAAAERRAEERGVGARLRAAVGDLDSLGEIAPGSVGLVLCHEVLGVAPDAAKALRQLRGVLRDGATLSLVVGQRPAAIMSRAVAGRLDQALALARGEDEGTPRRFDYAEVVALVQAAGFQVTLAQGVRIFADSIPSSVIDSDPAAAADLLELERTVAARPEFACWATQLHVLAQAGD